jgi:uncharacterized protein YabN with tetrapyrrole methylase and pyrophosphatase domain
MSQKNGGYREADIYIVGLGITGIEHMTRETEAVCRRSNEVLAVATHPSILKYLNTLCPKVTDLYAPSYREDEHRGKAYDTMTANVIAAALANPPVTFATYGHPMMYVFPSRQLRWLAPYFGLRVRTLPGISSLDTMLCDLGVDPGAEGLQMYEATDMLIRQRPIQPDVPCLIWQVGTVESVLFSTAASRPERFWRIKDYLLRYYPADHELTAVHSSMHPLLEPTTTTFRLGEMEDHHLTLHQGLTVYIPPVRMRPTVDTDLAEKIASVAHLESVTQPHTAARR